MNLAVIDPGVFVAGVYWRHESHLCLKAWLRGMMTPVMTEDMLAEYEAGLEQVKQEQSRRRDWKNRSIPCPRLAPIKIWPMPELFLTGDNYETDFFFRWLPSVTADGNFKRHFAPLGHLCWFAFG